MARDPIKDAERKTDDHKRLKDEFRAASGENSRLKEKIELLESRLTARHRETVAAEARVSELEGERDEARRQTAYYRDRMVERQGQRDHLEAALAERELVHEEVIRRFQRLSTDYENLKTLGSAPEGKPVTIGPTRRAVLQTYRSRAALEWPTTEVGSETLVWLIDLVMVPSGLIGPEYTAHGPLTPEKFGALKDHAYSTPGVRADRTDGRAGLFLAAVDGELERACAKWPPINTPHEGYAVILEELDEFWEEVRKKQTEHDPVAMRTELVQIAAMAARTAIEAIPGQGQGGER